MAVCSPRPPAPFTAALLIDLNSGSYQSLFLLKRWPVKQRFAAEVPAIPSFKVIFLFAVLIQNQALQWNAMGDHFKGTSIIFAKLLQNSVTVAPGQNETHQLYSQLIYGSSYDFGPFFDIFFPVSVVVPFVGFSANVFILWILFRKPGLCSTSDLFTANLAMLDALCSLLQPIEVIGAIFSLSDRMILCSVLLNQFAGPLFQTCTCVDCYIGVCYPITFLKFKEPRFCLATCAVVWATMVIFSIIAYHVGSDTSDTKVLECMAGFLIGELGIMFYCNIRILHALMQRGPGCQQVHPAKLRAYCTVVTLLIMVMVHYVTPVVNFLMISYNEVDRMSLFTIMSYMLACISGCNHPFFYLLRAGKIPWFFCPKI